MTSALPDRSIPDKARRVIEAAEELHDAARAYGLDPERIGELHAPFAMRCDAFCYRVEREREAWTTIFSSPLFTPRETLWPVAS